MPQGTVMGPILYNLFTADQPKPGLNAELLQYADDTAVIGRAKIGAQAIVVPQTHIKQMEEYYAEWGLTVNGKKSELLVFEKSKPPTPTPWLVSVGGKTVASKPSVKYLGVMLNYRLLSSGAAKARM